MTPVIDLRDMHEDKLVYGSLRMFAPAFRSLGKCAALAGPASTLKMFEDNGLVHAVLEEQGAGRVLVVDGGGSLRCALVDGNLGKLAEENGWEGILLNGCVRDTCELAERNADIHVLVMYLRKSIRKSARQREVGMQMSGTHTRSGEWVYADKDGVLASQDMLE